MVKSKASIAQRVRVGLRFRWGCRLVLVSAWSFFLGTWAGQRMITAETMFPTTSAIVLASGIIIFFYLSLKERR